MSCRSASWLICVFMAVAIAADYSGLKSTTDSSTVSAVGEDGVTAAADLADLLDASSGAVVTLVAGETRLVAHRAVLAARCPVLAAIFVHDAPKASGGGQASVADVEGPALRHLVAYCYTLRAPQLRGTAHQLLAAADKFGLPALKSACEQQVAAQLSAETAAAAAVVAVRHGTDSHRQAVVAFVKAHLLHVMATRGWAEAMRSHPEDLLEVIRLMSRPSNETDSPATGDSRATAATSSSESSSTPMATAPPVEAYTTPPPGDAEVSRMSTPATEDSRATAAGTSSEQSCTPVAAAPPACPTPPPADAEVSRMSTPATEDSRATAAGTSSEQSCTPVAAAPPACPTPPPADAEVSRMRRLSGREKGRRLLEAAQQSRMSEMRAVLAAGADVGATDSDGWTALHWVARNGQVEMAKCLLAAGADVEARGQWKWTALFWAARQGQVEVAKALLSAGADLEARDIWQNTPLFLAAMTGHTAAVRFLVASCADPNATDANATTPLHWAAYNGHADAAAALLEAGADKGARNSSGRTPQDNARKWNDRQLINMLS
ncbi:poly [ADP-ribose] polymerase tankyrase-1-like [Schistocerca piceifrons]|uniref:poly [ADP-ribose] polymerase tankyrase-1-like n=2 Tax=Schistocerca TaxID=7008 RepID=UPI001F5EC96A|nr:poly [ADP-ribose] polymerase tankyrase-1-like [Schistocerca piceifrons]